MLPSTNLTTPRDKKRPAPRGSAAYPRKRAVTACQVCRSRRTKCDNQRPACGFCARTGAVCNYPTDTEDFSTYDAASLRILARLDDLEGQLQRIMPPIHSFGPPHQQVETERDASWLLPIGPDELLRMNDPDQPQLLHTLLSPVTNPVIHNVTSPTSVADLDASSSRRLVDNFFRYVHVKNPILQEAQTRRMVSQLCLYGADWSTESCLALLICALGSLATPFGPSDNVGPGTSAYSDARSYFRAAQRRLGNCLTRTGVIEAQCLFLAGVFQMCVFRPFDAWRLFSQALSCCQNFTFLREQTRVAQSPDDGRIQSASHIAEQAIYWSSWKSELELRSSWNMTDFASPSMGTLYPSFFPTPPPPASEEANEYSSENIGWYFYLTEISLRRMLSRMSHDILHFESKEERTVLEVLAQILPDRLQQVADWFDALPDTVSPRGRPEEDDVCKFILRGQIINAYEMLYWPFLAQYVFAQKEARIEVKFATLAETALMWHVERLKVNKAGFAHRHHGTWFMIFSCTRSVIMLLKAQDFNTNSDTSLELNMPSGWEEAVQEGIRLNELWQYEAFDAHRRLPYLHSLAQQVGVHVAYA